MKNKKKIDINVDNSADRIKTVIHHLGISFTEFSRKTNIPITTLRQISCGYMTISMKTAMKIHDKYSQFSVMWLTKNEGNMIDSNIEIPTISQDVDLLNDYKQIIKEKNDIILRNDQYIIRLEHEIENLKRNIDVLILKNESNNDNS